MSESRPGDSFVEEARLVEEARPLLAAEMQACGQSTYQELLAREGKLREHTAVTPSGNCFSICTQVLRCNDLECALEIRGSVHFLQGDEVRPLNLRAGLRVTPDDQKYSL